jgi:CxxC motif-containing protein
MSASVDGATAEGPIETFAYLCIQCPIGCRLEVDAIDGDVVEVRGASCRHGDRYARQEHADPRRWISTTVRATGGTVPRLPVRTSQPVPKARVLDVARALRHVEVSPPIVRGQVIVEDILDLGVAVVSTRTLDAPADVRRSAEDGAYASTPTSGDESR